MKKTISLLTNALLSSTLFWGVAVADGNDLIVKVPADLSAYCHMKFPAGSDSGASWDRPVLSESGGNIVDFYGPCDYDPLAADEISARLRRSFDEREYMVKL